MEAATPQVEPARSKAEQARNAYQAQLGQTQQAYRSAMRIYEAATESSYESERDTAINALDVAMRSLEHMAELTKRIHS